MKLDILMVSIRELSKSFPDWYVKSMHSHYHQGKKSTVIILTNNNFDEIWAGLDEEGRLVNRESLIERRVALSN